MLNVGRWCSKPISEAKGTLGYLPMVYTVIHYPLHFRSVSYSPMWSLPPPCLPHTSSYHLLLPVPTPTPLTHLPQTRKIQYLLIPQHLSDPQYLPPLRIQGHSQIRSHRNLLWNCILVPGNVVLHILQSYHIHSVLRRGGGGGVLPGYVLPDPWIFPHNPPRFPLVEYPHQSTNARGHYPSVCNIDQDGLHYCKVQSTRHTSIHAPIYMTVWTSSYVPFTIVVLLKPPLIHNKFKTITQHNKVLKGVSGIFKWSDNSWYIGYRSKCSLLYAHFH